MFPIASQGFPAGLERSHTLPSLSSFLDYLEKVSMTPWEPCILHAKKPAPGRWHCLVLVPASFYRNISASERRVPRLLFSNRESRLGPLSSASLFGEYALSGVQASGGWGHLSHFPTDTV